MNDLITLLPLITIFIFFYALLYIPQRRRNKKHREFIDNIQIGDNVVTESGIHGRVTTINKEQITLVLKKGEIIINKSYIQEKP
jgi:preprotein translocase subunit YajC|tara:strand:- start:512 stop:763 length:252 start_codon:yes stop_codon:yes gene_type:complete